MNIIIFFLPFSEFFFVVFPDSRRKIDVLVTFTRSIESLLSFSVSVYLCASAQWQSEVVAAHGALVRPGAPSAVLGAPAGCNPVAGTADPCSRSLQGPSALVRIRGRSSAFYS